MKSLGRKITLAAILSSTVLAGCQEKEAKVGRDIPEVKRTREVEGPISPKVELYKNVNYESLETAIIKGAKDLGYSVEIKDIYNTNFKLGSIKEMEEYLITKITLTAYSTSKKLEISVDKDKDYGFGMNSFRVYADKSVSNYEIKKYLETVSKYLPK